MILKVCGMREATNIATLINEVHPDWMGLIFAVRSRRRVDMIPTHCGLMPDEGSLDKASSTNGLKRVGVFVNQKAQDIITRIVNFKLDIVQLHGQETPTLCRNLRATVDPDIHKGIKIMKAISVETKEDIELWHDYADCVDYLLFDTKCVTDGGSGRQFDWSVLDNYDGTLPYLLSGGIGPDDAERVNEFMSTHPMCIGIDINSRFETAPAVKDVAGVKAFVEEIRN